MGSADEWVWSPDGTEGGLEYMDAGEGVRVFDVRGEWSDGFPSSGPVEKIGFAVHHAVTSLGDGSLEGDVALLGAIHAYHTGVNGWPGIGYHRVIGAGRRVYLVGGSASQRAHVAGLNHQWIGWCFLGTWTSLRPDEDRMAALRQGLQWETTKRGVPMLIAPHKRLIAGTLCPGGWAVAESWAGTVLVPGGGSPAPGPVPPGPGPSGREVFEEALRQAREAVSRLEQLDDQWGIP